MSEIRTQTKVCLDCKVEKPLDEFGQRKSRGHTYIKSYCKKCCTKQAGEWARNNRDKALAYRAQYTAEHRDRIAKVTRERRLRVKYDVAPGEIIELFEKQKGVCVICKRSLDLSSRHCVVDHDHTTGKVRALLCVNCNAGLGQFKEDVTILLSAIEYVKNYCVLYQC